MRMPVLRKRLEQHVEALALLDETKSCAPGALCFCRGEALIFSRRIEEAEAEFADSLPMRRYTVAWPFGWCGYAGRCRSAVTSRRSKPGFAWPNRAVATERVRIYAL